eukprot:688935-Pelagomonas_calceolata.AAC.2
MLISASHAHLLQHPAVAQPPPAHRFPVFSLKTLCSATCLCSAAAWEAVALVQNHAYAQPQASTILYSLSLAHGLLLHILSIVLLFSSSPACSCLTLAWHVCHWVG